LVIRRVGYAGGTTGFIWDADFRAEVVRVATKASAGATEPNRPRKKLGPEMALKEKQAAALSGELLIPMTAAIGAALSGGADEQVAEQFDVGLQFAAWRMNASGARKIAQRTRQKRAAGIRR
jgi:hypothetical protein